MGFDLSTSWPLVAIAAGAIMLLFKKPRLLGGQRDMYLALALIVLGVFAGGYLNSDSFVAQDIGGGVTSVTLGTGYVNLSTTGIAVNSVNKQQYDVTATDAATAEDIVVNSTVTALRSGDAKAAFIPASCTASDHNNPSDPTDVNKYNIVSKDTSGAVECFINGVQGTNTIGFTEGTASSSVVLSWKWSEAGHDKTNQYDSRFVTFNIGGQTVTFKVTRLEAAS